MSTHVARAISPRATLPAFAPGSREGKLLRLATERLLAISSAPRSRRTLAREARALAATMEDVTPSASYALLARNLVERFLLAGRRRLQAPGASPPASDAGAVALEVLVDLAAAASTNPDPFWPALARWIARRPGGSEWRSLHGPLTARQLGELERLRDDLDLDAHTVALAADQGAAPTPAQPPPPSPVALVTAPLDRGPLDDPWGTRPRRRPEPTAIRDRASRSRAALVEVHTDPRWPVAGAFVAGLAGADALTWCRLDAVAPAQPTEEPIYLQIAVGDDRPHPSAVLLVSSEAAFARAQLWCVAVARSARGIPELHPLLERHLGAPDRDWSLRGLTIAAARRS